MRNRTARYGFGISILAVLTVAMMFSAASAGTGNADCLKGKWEGCIEFSSSQPQIVLELKSAKDGNLTGELSLPDQEQFGMPVENILVEGNKICFDLVNERARACFKGELSTENNCITGDFEQAGYKYPFRLEPTGSEQSMLDK